MRGARQGCVLLLSLLFEPGLAVIPPRPVRRAAAPRLTSSSGGGRDAALSMLRWYKSNISPLLPPGCRFLPTCSEYAMQSFEQFSLPQAAVLTAWRLMRCNPLHLPGCGSGIDEPVWPPPAYWAGDGRVRTPLDDEQSRRRADGLDDTPLVPPWELPEVRGEDVLDSAGRGAASNAESGASNAESGAAAVEGSGRS
mmetsp:Transcript_35575/g.80788  ORF Transcript_35575/g.80788 Transcript_35575/m.80788 type:complete len:196 (-) Transcript_35575:177-764(-)